jgi:phosphate transport system protein
MRKEGQETITQQLAKTPEHSEALVRWLAVVRHLERLGDFATNIAEDVIYMVEGEIVRHQRKLSKLSGNK